MELSPEDYKKIKEEAKELYRVIGQVWCPRLNDYVFFNKKGFDHFIWKGKSSRPKIDQINRFSLIKYAPLIISDASASMTHSLWTHHTSLKPTIHFWGFTSRTEKKSIRVVVRQIGKGRKHFFSIFSER